MKKKLLISAIAATSFVSSAAFAIGGDPVATVTPAKTTVHWTGSLADIIPGDNIVITGVSGSVEIAPGNLNMTSNGTFESSDIGLESHTYDPDTQVIGDDAAPATWTLQAVTYAWGDNQTANTNVEVIDTLNGDLAPLVVGAPVTGVSSMSLKVQNIAPLAITDITDPSATAQVNVTMTAAFEA